MVIKVLKNWRYNMLNYLNGFLTSLLLFCSFFVVMGAKYGGSQHFGDIIANSITIADKNGFGGVLKVVDKEGNTLLAIKNGSINVFNEQNAAVVDIKTGIGGEGVIFLKNGGNMNTFNENGLKTTSIGENSFGQGMISTFNINSKLTSSIGSVVGGSGKLSIFDNQGRETIHLTKSLTTFNQDGKITGKYGTTNAGHGSVLLYDKFGNRGWYKSGKNS